MGRVGCGGSAATALRELHTDAHHGHAGKPENGTRHRDFLVGGERARLHNAANLALAFEARVRPDERHHAAPEPYLAGPVVATPAEQVVEFLIEATHRVQANQLGLDAAAKAAFCGESHVAADEAE